MKNLEFKMLKVMSITSFAFLFSHSFLETPLNGIGLASIFIGVVLMEIIYRLIR